MKVDEKCSFPKMKAQKTCDKIQKKTFQKVVHVPLVCLKNSGNSNFVKKKLKFEDSKLDFGSECRHLEVESLLSNFAISWKHILGLSSFT